MPRGRSAENRRPLDVWPLHSVIQEPWKLRQRCTWLADHALRSSDYANPKESCLAFVRLAHDRWFVDSVLFVVLVVVLFVVIRISGWHRVAHDRVDTPVDPGRNYLWNL